MFDLRTIKAWLETQMQNAKRDAEYGVSTAGSYDQEVESYWDGYIFALTRCTQEVQRLIDAAHCTRCNGPAGETYKASYQQIHCESCYSKPGYEKRSPIK